MPKPNTGTAGASIVWVVSYIFFLFNLADNLSASHDSINYLNHISRGEHLFHQHHLLYHFFAYQWLQLWQGVFPQAAEHRIVEAFTALWGSSSLAVCFLFLRNRFGLRPSLSYAGITVIAFSYGFWFYSMNVEVYMPPLFWMLCALYLMTRKTAEQKDPIFVGVLHSAAILFHQVNILFLPVVFYWLYSQRNNTPVGRSIATYSGVLATITGSLYFLIGWIVEGKSEVSLFASWLLGYTVGHDYWQPFSAYSPVQALAGFARSIIGGHFIFQLPMFNDALQSVLGSHRLNDELYLSRNIPVVAAWLLTCLSAAMGLFFLLMVYRFVRHFRKMNMHRHLLNPLLLTVAVYSLFFMFWEPEVLEFWILQMVMVWLMLVGMAPLTRFPLHLGNAAGIVVLSVSLLVINYFGSIKWLQDFRNDWYHNVVKALPATSADLVIVEDEWILKDYVRYYTKASVIATDEKLLTRDEISAAVRNVIAKKGKVYLYDGSKRQIANGNWKVIQFY